MDIKSLISRVFCTSKFRSFGILFAIIIGFQEPAHSATSVIGFGYNFQAGAEDNSLAGMTSFTGSLASETSKGNLRGALIFGATYGSGIITYQGELVDIVRMGAEVKVGPSLHMFTRGVLLPVISIYGVIAADLMQSDNPPTGASISHVALATGYELEAGMSLPFRKSSRLRILGAYRKQTAKYGAEKISFDYVAGRLAVSF